MPPFSESVRTISVPAFTPSSSHPADDGQYLRPLTTKSSPSRTAVRPTPRDAAAGCRSSRCPRVAGRLARGPPAEVLAGRIGRRRAQEALLLLLGAVPGHRHEPETVTEHRAGEARVHDADLLRRDDQVDARHPAAAVLGREHAHRDPGLVGLDVGRLRHLEALERVGLRVGRGHHGLQHVLGEGPDLVLQLLLLVRHREVDGHPRPLSRGDERYVLCSFSGARARPGSSVARYPTPRKPCGTDGTTSVTNGVAARQRALEAPPKGPGGAAEWWIVTPRGANQYLAYL